MLSVEIVAASIEYEYDFHEFEPWEHANTQHS